MRRWWNRIWRWLSAADAAGVGENVDLAVLKVALMVAALDGEIGDSEYETIRNLATRCRGCSAEEIDAALEAGKRSAGYLLLMATRSGEDKLETTFVSEALASLPRDFVARGTKSAVRDAFITWNVIAMSDGDFSERERRCLDALRRRISDRA